jgi:hypothetical protein
MESYIAKNICPYHSTNYSRTYYGIPQFSNSDRAIYSNKYDGSNYIAYERRANWTFNRNTLIISTISIQQGGLFSIHPTFVSNSDAQNSLAGDGGIIVPPTYIPMETASMDITPLKSKTSIEPLGITMITAFDLVIFIVYIWEVSTIGYQRRRMKEDTNYLAESNSRTISMCLSEVENIGSLSMTALEEGTNNSTSKKMTREEDKIEGDDYITAEEIDCDTTNHVAGKKGWWMIL